MKFYKTITAKTHEISSSIQSRERPKTTKHMEKPYKLIEVKWLDACGSDGFVTEEELLKETPILHTSVGYVINDTKEAITITMSWDEKKTNLGAWLLIPKAYIKKLKKL